MTSHTQNPLFRRASQAGFTLVEIMVGLAIGMLTTLIILQVFSVFETQKRSTTGTADAQTNGTIALFSIERELQNAGYPLMALTTSPLQCTTLTLDGGAVSSVRISPVSIADGGTGSDTLTIRYGDSSKGGISSQITAMVGSVATLDNNFGCAPYDRTIITNGTTCAMSIASAVTAASTVPAQVTLNDTTAAANGAYLACLGTWHEVTFAVNTNGDLVRSDLATATSAVAAPGIVNLQAQYGISASANSNQVTSWVDATGGTWATPAVADRNRIKAVRVSVVARNAKREGATVTAANCPTTGTATGLCAWVGSASSPAPTAVLSSANADWAHYRYRVFDTIIPLRNVIWSKGKL
jgi:type IV pilus assembly protein PilW